MCDCDAVSFDFVALAPNKPENEAPWAQVFHINIAHLLEGAPE